MHWLIYIFKKSLLVLLYCFIHQLKQVLDIQKSLPIEMVLLSTSNMFFFKMQAVEGLFNTATGQPSTSLNITLIFKKIFKPQNKKDK